MTFPISPIIPDVSIDVHDKKEGSHSGVLMP